MVTQHLEPSLGPCWVSPSVNQKWLKGESSRRLVDIFEDFSFFSGEADTFQVSQLAVMQATYFQLLDPLWGKGEGGIFTLAAFVKVFGFSGVHYDC